MTGLLLVRIAVNGFDHKDRDQKEYDRDGDGDLDRIAHRVRSDRVLAYFWQKQLLRLASGIVVSTERSEARKQDMDQLFGFVMDGLKARTP